VGDENQAIYAFRGADANGIARLKVRLNTKVLGLTTTYRCGKAIVEVARKLVPHFEAGASNPEGIVDSATYDGLFDAARPGDFILSRKNAPLMALCLGFLKRGIKARIEGRDIGKELAATVKRFKADSVPRFVERVQGWSKKQAKKAAKIKGLEAKQAKLDEISDQTEVLLALAEGCDNVAAIVSRCDTLFGESRENEVPPAIVLSSVHKAKGLEADRVFVLADTLNTRNVEECNISYVAWTRAKRQLTMTVRA
jgi:superfamily I DNA/RNA helicase